MSSYLYAILLWLGLSCMPTWLYAGILAGTTRVIYTEKDTEKTVMLVNTNAYPVFTQVWVDDSSSNPDFENPPFIVLPTVFHLLPKEIKAIRILYNKMPLATDRESVYWLNLYEIPAVKKSSLAGNGLNVAMNTQLKVFFRPKQLKPMQIDEINSNLRFELTENGAQSAQLDMYNTTAYHVTAINLTLLNKTTGAIAYTLLNTMASPFGQSVLNENRIDFNPAQTYVMQYTLLDDQGNKHFFEKPLSSAK